MVSFLVAKRLDFGLESLARLGELVLLLDDGCVLGVEVLGAARRSPRENESVLHAARVRCLGPSAALACSATCHTWVFSCSA